MSIGTLNARACRTAAAVAAAALIGAGCGSEEAPPPDGSRAPASTTTTVAAADTSATAKLARRGAKVRVIDSRFGRVLADGRGFVLYLFTRDGRGPSRCYGACAKAWPPLLTRGAPQAVRGARDRLLGTTRRRGGRRQVTYRGQPLYYYVGDRRPGQILCQDVFEFGGTWLVVAPDGRAVR